MTEAKGYPAYSDQDWERRYELLYKERIDTIHNQDHTSSSLQESHEQIIRKAICLALNKTESEWGQPPAHFAFFLMGSGGRREQSFWSDQDHGLVFESDNEEDEIYFLQLGKEIVYALAQIGYKRCDGYVMASNSRWCRSFTRWENQLKGWLKEDTWETLRYTLTFVDSTTIYGDSKMIESLKQTLFREVNAKPYVLKRLTENTGRLKKGIGLFNQLLVETKGKHKGRFDFKQVVLFPYVNALRLLAIEQQIFHSPTTDRFQLLPKKYHSIKQSQRNFEEMLEKRLEWHKHTKTYEDIHHLQLEKLTASERKLLKKWIREGHRLYQNLERNLKKGEHK